MSSINFKDCVIKTKVGDDDLTVTSDITGTGDGIKFRLEIKDDDWSFTIDGSSGAKFKTGNDTFSVTKPDAGEFPFPKISLTHDNKELELPGKAGKINSSTEMSGLPLTLTLNASLTRSGEEITVTEEVQKLFGTKRSFKVEDWIAEEPTFENAGTLDQLVLGILLGPESFRFAKKVTLNFGEISVSPLKDSKTKVKVDNTQSSKIEIRPYVTLEKLVEITNEKAIELANAIKDLASAKEALRDYDRKLKEQIDKQKNYDRTKIAIKVVTGIIAVATTALCLMWWNPGGWASGALVAEKAAELTALAFVLDTLAMGITVLTTTLVSNIVLTKSILTTWDINVPDTHEGVQIGVNQLEKKVNAMKRNQEKRVFYKTKMTKQESTILRRIRKKNTLT